MIRFEASERGSAAAQCGKALPFRCSLFFEGEAAPRLGGLASFAHYGRRAGKAKPYRTVRRQSRKTIFLIFGLFSLALTNLWSSAVDSRSLHSQEGFEMPVQERARVRAPELSGGRGWLNTDKPLSLSALKGKVVLLDFWTYGCINCMHIIPDLKKLEHKYANELVVIGVHSAKFPAEKGTENIRQAILRYEIEHPVVNDHEMQIWQEYTVRSWPTLFLIDPAGKVVAYMSGEGVYAQFDKYIAKVIETFDAKKMIDRRPLNLKLERQRTPTSVLAFPGKVLADEKSK